MNGLSNNMFVAWLLGGEEDDVSEERLCREEGNVIQLRPKKQREKFDNITDWKTLYKWTIDQIERKSEKRSYNKVIADFAEYVVTYFDIHVIYPSFKHAKYPE